MSFIENVIVSTKHMEKLLSDLGGTGKGLYEKANSVSSLLNYPLLKRIQFVATVRNKLLHVHGYTFDGDQGVFLCTCEGIISDVMAIIVARSQPPAARAQNVVSPPLQEPAVTQTANSSDGTVPAIITAVICLIVLPFTCTKTVKEGWFIVSTKQVPDWEVIIIWTLILAASVFYLARSITKHP